MPNANTRVEGSLSGQYHFADLLPVESYARLEAAGLMTEAGRRAIDAARADGSFHGVDEFGSHVHVKLAPFDMVIPEE